MADTNRWSTVRCLFESPILDDRKWAKIPSIEADAFILDLEDAVPVPGKEQARGKVVEFVGRPEYFGGRLTVPRPNALSTPWGHDDVVALAKAGAPTLMLPKVDRRQDIDDVLALCAEHGSSPSIVASIESAEGVLNVREIFAHEAVVAATFGPGDLHVDAGMALYEPDGSMNPGLLGPKVQAVLAGRVHHVPVLSIAFTPDLKDLAEVRKRVAAEKRLGFNGCCAFYPPHVAVINEEFTPSADAVEAARKVVELYEAAVAQGRPAVQLENGEALLTHQYQEAQKVLARAR
ncbi:MAG TPA: CoA ester lyase [Amycolatopsis sp.]|nr:CoA ester lyase [Amycolatopsis sp.]